MRKIVPALGLAFLTGCTVAPPPPMPNPAAAARLAQMLAGKAPGRPERCLPAASTADLIPMDGNHVAYRAGSTIYVSTTEGSCGLGPGTTLVTRSGFGASGPCRDDVAHVVDSSSGMTIGSCTFGDFVPYRPIR